MEKIYSYFLLIAALITVSIFGTQTIKFPDSFAKLGTLPSIDEWRDSRVRATANR